MAAAVGVRRRRRSRVTVMAQWVLPPASAPTGSVCRCRVCGGTVDTANVGSRALACPPICIVLHERGPLPRNR
jgi:hypothetical protein